MRYDTLATEIRDRRHPRVTARTKTLRRRSDRHAARQTLADWMIYE